MSKNFDRALELAKMPHSEKVEKEFSSCLEKMTPEERQNFMNQTVRMFHPEFCEKLENDLNFKAKVIACYVRSNMEDFHCEHLKDSQMTEQNPLIRNAIYTALKDFEDGNLLHAFCVQHFNLAPYWEDCEYVEI